MCVAGMLLGWVEAARLGQAGIVDLGRRSSLHLYKPSSCGVCPLNLESARNIAHRWVHQAHDLRLEACDLSKWPKVFPCPPPRPVPKQSVDSRKTHAIFWKLVLRCLQLRHPLARLSGHPMVVNV